MFQEVICLFFIFLNSVILIQPLFQRIIQEIEATENLTLKADQGLRMPGNDFLDYRSADEMTIRDKVGLYFEEGGLTVLVKVH